MFDFSTVTDRHGTWCTQWDYVADRFGVPDLLPFTISDMDFPTAPCVLAALQQRLTHGVLGYSRWNNDAFLSAVAHWYQRRFHIITDIGALVYGPSVMYMVSQLIRQWSQPGDGIAIHTPAYDAFYKTIDGNQRRALAVPLLKQGNSWQCDMTQLETVLARPECRILLLCSPHNPTGKVWTRTELETIVTLCEQHDVRVISDEIHMDMVWDGAHTPWCAVGRGSWALLSAASKSFNIPALTGAWGLISDDGARADYLAALKGRDGLSSPAVLALAAHIAAYWQGEPWLDALRDYLQRNLQYVAARLNAAFPALNWQPPAATYLAWIDLRALHVDDEALQTALIHQQKVAIMPGTTYGPEGKGFIRLNVGCPHSKLEMGIKGLIAALNTVMAHSGD